MEENGYRDFMQGLEELKKGYDGMKELIQDEEEYPSPLISPMDRDVVAYLIDAMLETVNDQLSNKDWNEDEALASYILVACFDKKIAEILKDDLFGSDLLDFYEDDFSEAVRADVEETEKACLEQIDQLIQKMQEKYIEEWRKAWREAAGK